MRKSAKCGWGGGGGVSISHHVSFLPTPHLVGNVHSLRVVLKCICCVWNSLIMCGKGQ